MKKRHYTRYKRYEREGGLVEWLIRTRPKLPRGKGGRPASVKKYWAWSAGRKGEIIVSQWDGVREAWYGPGQDYELCQALAFSFKHPKPAVRKEARMIVLDRVSQAFRANDKTIFHRMADAVRAVHEAPWNSLGVAVTVAHKILSDKGNKEPKAVELVRMASQFFREPGPAPELDSLNASLFREVRNYLKFLEHLEHEND